MYSSNQHLDITCDFNQFPAVLDCIICLSGTYECMTREKQRVKPAFRITDNGLYLLHLGSMPADPVYLRPGIECQEGWTDFPFDYDPEKIARIIQQWAEAQPDVKAEYTNGSVKRGIRIRHPNALPAEEFLSLQSSQHISLLHTLAVFQPFMLTYDK